MKSMRRCINLIAFHENYSWPTWWMMEHVEDYALHVFPPSNQLPNPVSQPIQKKPLVITELIETNTNLSLYSIGSISWYIALLFVMIRSIHDFFLNSWQKSELLLTDCIEVINEIGHGAGLRLTSFGGKLMEILLLFLGVVVLLLF